MTMNSQHIHLPERIANQYSSMRSGALKDIKEMDFMLDAKYVEEEHYGQLETQIGAMVMGFVAGRAMLGKISTDQDLMVDFITNQFCPTCITAWYKYREACCFSHLLMKFVGEVLSENIEVRSVEDGPPSFASLPDGPSLN